MEEIDYIDLPQFTRRIGVLGEAGLRPDSKATDIGVLAPFQGVLGLSVIRSDQPIFALDYLALTGLISEGFRDRNRRGQTSDKRRSVPELRDASATSAPSATTDGESELKVYHLLRDGADEQVNQERSRTGESDKNDLEFSDYTSREEESGRDKDSASTIVVREGRSADQDMDSIQGLRQLRPESTVLGGSRRGSPEPSRILASPRTVLATVPIPTRATGTASPMRTGNQSVGSGDSEESPHRSLDVNAPGNGGGDPSTTVERRTPTSPGDPGRVDETRPGTSQDISSSIGREDANSVRNDIPNMDTVTHPEFDMSMTVTEGPSDSRPDVPLTVISQGDPDLSQEGQGSNTGALDSMAGRDRDGHGATAPTSASERRRTGEADVGATPGTPSTESGDTSSPFPEHLSLEGGGPDSRFIEELYRELMKKMRIERERGGY